MLATLIPNVDAGLDTSLTLVAAAITAYMVPFAALQLVSGTLAERLGPRRVVRTGYVLYGTAALASSSARWHSSSPSRADRWEASNASQESPACGLF
jgi:MFS family permease